MENDKRVSPKSGPTVSLPVILSTATAEAARLGKMERWQLAFRHAAPELPMMVERLDQPGTYYYIAGFRTGPRVTGRLRLNAHTGKYVEATGISTVDRTLTRYQTPDEVWARLFLPRSRKSAGGGSTRLTPVLEPMLVWQPSQQSRTPFLPFYRVKFGRKTRYFRVDGPDFDELSQSAGN